MEPPVLGVTRSSAFSRIVRTLGRVPNTTTSISVLSLAITALLTLGGCGDATSAGPVDEGSAGSSAASPEPSRAAGAVTKKVRLCFNNNLSEPIEIAPTGPYGEFMSVEPGRDACYNGDNLAGDPVAAVTFANDSVVYVYGRNPVFGRPDIRLCSDQDCKTVRHQFDLSEGDSKSKTLDGVRYTATRDKDSGDSIADYKYLTLTVS